MDTGDRVAFRGGNTEYKAVVTHRGWADRKYTLISVKTGRKRYNVSEKDLVPWEDRKPVPAVKTSRGMVRRPKNWQQLPAFSGGTRRAFLGKRWVFKKAFGTWGTTQCQTEACLYLMQSGASNTEIEKKFTHDVISRARRFQRHNVRVAECYLLEDGTLVMERVTPVNSLQARDGAPTMSAEERRKHDLGWGGNGWPDWVRHVDSNQIGANRKGELVAYDI